MDERDVDGHVFPVGLLNEQRRLLVMSLNAGLFGLHQQFVRTVELAVTSRLERHEGKAASRSRRCNELKRAHLDALGLIDLRNVI